MLSFLHLEVKTMKLKNRLSVLQTLIAAVIVALLLSSVTPAHPHDKRWRSRDKHNKKAEKFINGHDARDGRWDGRGPRNKRRGGWDDCDRCDDDWRRRRRPRRW